MIIGIALMLVGAVVFIDFSDKYQYDLHAPFWYVIVYNAGAVVAVIGVVVFSIETARLLVW